MDEIRQALESAVKRHGNVKAAARALQLPEEAVRRVLGGKSLRGANYRLFLSKLDLERIVSASAFVPKKGTAVDDHIAALIKEGQAEAAAWILEFAARVLEAGAKRLRTELNREAIVQSVEVIEDAKKAKATKPRATRLRGSGGR